jgi:hypothetical protein
MWLEPDPRGLGTHEQAGRPACSWPVYYGIPCPTCGMTTAVAHAARFDWPAAFRAQPAGALLAAGGYLAGALAAWVLVSGRGWRVNWYRFRPSWALLIVLGVLALGWGYKIITWPGP